MWPKAYRDYPENSPLKKETVGPGKGIIGCEMHEVNGWGEPCYVPRKKKRGFFSSIIHALFGTKDTSEEEQ